jgi:hypothetical protein
LLAAITQLAPSFSKAVSNPAGDGAQGDLTNPEHYRLVNHGGDGVLSTIDCTSSLGGDDWEIPTGLPLLAWEGDGTASIVDFDLQGLERGVYSLMLCDLEDLEGDQLAEPWIRSFVVNASNLLEDPNFDHEFLSAWDTESPSGSDIFWDTADPSTPHSGVAVIDPSASGAGESFSLTQCIDVSQGVPYALSGTVSIESDMTTAPSVTGRVEFFRDFGCVDSLEIVERAFASGDTNLHWGPRKIVSAQAPAEALSARVGFVVEGGAADQFLVFLDETAFFVDVIFVDGFESGDAFLWSSVVGD